MLYVLYGGDELAVRRRLTQLRDQADGGSGMLDSNLTVLDATQASSDAILGAAMAVPFLGPRRLVVAEGLLDRFAGGAGRGGEGDTGSRRGRGLDQLEPLLAVLERDELPPTTDLVITGTTPITGTRPPRNPLLERLRRAPGVSIEEFRPPEKADLFRFIRGEAAARGIRWKSGRSPREGSADGPGTGAADPVAMLAERFGSDTLALASELDKLALYSMGNEIGGAEVDLVCGGEKASTVFNLVDAVMDGDLRTAFAALEYLRAGGTSAQALLGMLTTSYRRLAVIVDHLERGDDPEAIGKAINLPWAGLRDRAIARARRHGMEGVLQAYRLIVDADRRLKLGEMDEDLAVDSLLLSLSELGPAATAGRAGAGRRRA